MAASDKPYRSQSVLDIVFGVSCGLMLLTTVWMFWADYNRDFKGVQRTFRDVEAALAEREAVDRLPKAETVKEKRLALRDARKRLEFAGAGAILGENFEAIWEDYRSGNAATKAAAEKKLRGAQAQFNNMEKELIAKREKADDKYRGIKADYDANNSYLIIAADDATKYPEGTSTRKSYEEDKQKIQKKIENLEAALTDAKRKLDAVDQEYREKVRAVLDKPERDVGAAEDDMKKVAGAFERFSKQAAQKSWGFGDTFRALPILDAFESPVKIKQIWLPDLTIDYSFKEVPRYDRCTTCHLGIDRPAYTKQALVALGDDQENARLTGKLHEAKKLLDKRSEKDIGFDPEDLPSEPKANIGFLSLLMVLCVAAGALSLGILARSTRLGLSTLLSGLGLTVVFSAAMAMTAPRDIVVKTVKLDQKKGEVTQFAAHPRLDLFVDNNSPHGMEKFGCTICHAGQGSATDFNLASHTANDSQQEKNWKDEHGWEHSHFWDYPMLSKRFVESSCVKCHHQMTDLVRYGSKEEAPKLLRGYNLVKENGCFGCHEISGLKSGRPVGPDLRLEPAPALEYLSPAEQDRARSDPANPPGTMRKVGPSLRRLAEKTNEEWVRKWVLNPRGFRPDTKMPHFFGLSTNSEEALAKTAPNQATFPSTEIHAIAYYLLTESKGSLKGEDFYREMLLKGKQNISELEATLVKTGLPDKEVKELYDASRKFTDVALLSNPMDAKTINAHALRQRQLQERIAEIQKRVAEQRARNVPEATIKEAQTEIDKTGEELKAVGAELEKAAKPVTIAERIIGEDGSVVSFPEKAGDAAAGRVLFTERACLACHAHEGTTKAAKGAGAVTSEANFAPELSRIAAKLSPAVDPNGARRWLVQWLLNPNVHHPRTRMPITHLTPAQANDIATWLLSQKVTDWQGVDPTAPDIGNLKALGRVYLAKAPGVTLADLDQFLPPSGKNGEAGKSVPQSEWGIPKERLTNPEDRLSNLTRDAEERRLEKGKVTKEVLLWYIGKKAIGKQGCFACHDIPGFESAKPIGTALNEWGKKDADRLAFEDSEVFAREHYNIVPTRTTRKEVEDKVVALWRKGGDSLDNETKQKLTALLKERKDISTLVAEQKDNTLDRSKADVLDAAEQGLDKSSSTELKRLKRQFFDQARILELEEKQESKEGLKGKEEEELSKIRPGKFFETVKTKDGRTKEPIEEVFFEALEHPARVGFLHQKLLDPRSYDYNREKAWDDRLRMPQFKFARSRKKPGETDEHYHARQEKDEAEAREAVMTFILGLTAEPIPLKYIAQPTGERKAEVDGRQVLDKFNCAGCHQVRPGIYEFKATDQAIKLAMKAYENASGNFNTDHVFPGHSAWTGTPQSSDRMLAYGYFDRKQTEELSDPANADVIYLTEALRFTGDDKVTRDLPAASYLFLPRGQYSATPPFGGTFTELMIPYLQAKNSQLYPPNDPGQGKTRGVLPPPLVREGERVQPDWLYKFLLNPGPIRPESYMILRMPKFNMSSEEARALVNYFAAASRTTNPGAGITYPYVAIEQREQEHWKRLNDQYAKQVASWLEKTKKDLADAEKQSSQKKGDKDLEARIADLKASINRRSQSKDIYAKDAFMVLTNPELCLKCHQIGNLPSESPKAPNLVLTAERLRPEWVEQWVANPARLFPYPPEMPQNFPNNKEQYQDRFVGTPRQQVAAIRDILMDLPRLNHLLANPPQAPAAGGSKK
jgi:mono/diheme cytochrome c family protein